MVDLRLRRAEVERISTAAANLVRETSRRDASLVSAFTALRAEQARRALDALPLERLVTKGIAAATIALLHGARLRRVTDVAGGRASIVPGIGRHKAMLLDQRLDALRREANDHAKGNLEAALRNDEERALAWAALNVLDAKAAWTDVGASLLQAIPRVRADLAGCQAQVGFWRWLGRGCRVPPQANDAISAALRASDLGDMTVRTDALAGEVASSVAPGGAHDLQSAYSSRRIDVLDLLVGRFNQTQLQGGLAEQVARRIERFELRPSLKNVALRPYQTFGAKFMGCQRRVLLGDEMGLGKTLQALALATHLKTLTGRVRVVALVPSSLVENWRREIERFTDLRVLAALGPEFDDAWNQFLKYGDVVLVTYDTARDRLRGRCGTLKLDLVICDEAHFIKNPGAGRTQVARELIDVSEHAVLLTGTPLENHVGEMVRIIEAVQAPLAKKLLGRGHDLDAAISPTEFTQLVAPVYLRRTQADVLRELPERIEMEEWLTLEGAHLAKYIEVLRSSTVLPVGLRARKFHDARRAAVLGAGSDSPKLARLQELRDEYAALGRKLLVFSYYLDVLSKLRELFRESLYLAGEIPPRDRQGVIDRFTSTPGHAMLLSQITSGGLGLNIQAASVVILMEPQVKPSIEAQAIARAHRMGQRDVVRVHRLYARDTLEERIYRRLAEKSARTESFAQESRLKAVAVESTRVDDVSDDRLQEALMAEELQRHMPAPRDLGAST